MSEPVLIPEDVTRSPKRPLHDTEILEEASDNEEREPKRARLQDLIVSGSTVYERERALGLVPPPLDLASSSDSDEEAPPPPTLERENATVSTAVGHDDHLYLVKLPVTTSVPAVDMKVTGAGSFYVVRVLDLGSHYFLCALDAHEPKPYVLTSVYESALFPKELDFTVTADRLLPYLVSTWRDHNKRGDGVRCSDDTLAWMLYCYECVKDGGEYNIGGTLDLNENRARIDAYFNTPV